MSERQSLPDAASSATQESPGLLERVMSATRQTEPDRAQDLVRTLVERPVRLDKATMIDLFTRRVFGGELDPGLVKIAYLWNQ